MKLRYWLAFLRTMKIPGLIPLLRDWKVFVRWHYIHAAVECGLIDALLSGPSGRDELIRKLGVERPEILDALLDLGLSAKELALENGTYRIRGKRSKATAGSKGDMPAAMIQANVTYYNSAYRHAAKRMKGSPLGKDLGEIGEVVARYAKIGEPVLSDFIKDITPAKKPFQVLDVGCGSGVFLQGFHRANRHASGIGLEIDPAVANQARRNLEDWGLNDRFEIIEGDIRNPPVELKGPFDIITLFNILYYFESSAHRSLMKTVRELLAPGGAVVVAMLYRSNGSNIGAAYLNMVNCSLEGLTGLFDPDDIVALLTDCGFGRIEKVKLMPASTFYGIVASA